jgi:hypothetical protein
MRVLFVGNSFTFRNGGVDQVRHNLSDLVLRTDSQNTVHDCLVINIFIFFTLDLSLSLS